MFDQDWEEVEAHAERLLAGDRIEYASRAALVLLRCVPALRAADKLLSIETARYAEPVLLRLARRERLTYEEGHQFSTEVTPVYRELDRVPFYGIGPRCAAREIAVAFWLNVDECSKWSVGASKSDFVHGAFATGAAIVELAAELWPAARPEAEQPTDDDCYDAYEIERDFALRVVEPERLDAAQIEAFLREQAHRALREVAPPVTGLRRWLERLRR